MEQSSLERTKAYYTQKIEESPDWELAGIFADEGITGTSMKKRKEFNRMITACKRGRIDLILTKSLSRFARNTVDCLETVRMLKARGIGVIFEKENINTLTESSEFLITLFSGFAQAESESLSSNIQLGIRMAMKEGKVNFHYRSMLGYQRGADGKPEIVPEEAEVVRRVCGRRPAAKDLHHRLHKQEGQEEYRRAAAVLYQRQPHCHHSKGHLPAGTGGNGKADQQAENPAEKWKNRTGQVFRQICAQ